MLAGRQRQGRRRRGRGLGRRQDRGKGRGKGRGKDRGKGTVPPPYSPMSMTPPSLPMPFPLSPSSSTPPLSVQVLKIASSLRAALRRVRVRAAALAAAVRAAVRAAVQAAPSVGTPPQGTRPRGGLLRIPRYEPVHRRPSTSPSTSLHRPCHVLALARRCARSLRGARSLRCAMLGRLSPYLLPVLRLSLCIAPSPHRHLDRRLRRHGHLSVSLVAPSRVYAVPSP